MTAGAGAVATALFETPIGWCGLAWGARGITAVQLPERDRAATAARLARRLPTARPATEVPAPIVAVCDRIVAVLGGGHDDLADVVLDLDGVGAFEAQVYAVARAIAPGDTSTYGEVAARVGSPGSARAVGQAMGRNPCPLIVPCHRVLAAHGAAGGFSAYGGVVTKRRLLFLEGAIPAEPLSLFDG